MQLLANHCSGPHGYWSDEESITLDASNCSEESGLQDKAKVIGIESHPIWEADKWFDTFKSKCANGKKITFHLENEKALLVPCNIRLSDSGRLR